MTEITIGDLASAASATSFESIEIALGQVLKPKRNWGLLGLAPNNLMDALKKTLHGLQDQDPIILTFVHGWKHNADTADDNLINFCRAAANVSSSLVTTRPVLAIFVAWRGLSLYGLRILENITFWDRKQAGLRVAMGAPRELFACLQRFRRDRMRAGGHPLVAMIGHSFGGLLVYTAIAQSLIESVASGDARIIPALADLVVLVNPAFEAVRYLPIHDIVRSRIFVEDQEPVFVSVTATNDWATGYAFPAGMAFALIQESTKGKEERQALIRTMGHIPWMQTHRLTLHGDRANLARDPNWKRNPFWVVSASPRVVDGHNGIWKPVFQAFLQDLLSKHAQQIQRWSLRHTTPE